jgi:hypothetical protein
VIRRGPSLKCHHQTAAEECGCVSRGDADGWAAFLGEDIKRMEPSSLGIFCPRCAALEFDYRVEETADYT